MEEKILMLSKRIDVLEKRVLDLENIDYKIRDSKRLYNFIDKETIIDILSEAISIGTIKEDAMEYILDKNIVYSIIYKKNIRKYYFNKILKEMDFVIGQRCQNVAYKQVRVEGKNIWAYVINKKLFKKYMEE